MELQHDSHHTHPKSQRGTALWELVFGAAVIIFTGIIVIPELIWHHHPANENAAVATLRMLTSAQEVYQAKCGVFGAGAQLGPKGARLLDGHIAQATRDNSVERSGYYFRMHCKPDGCDWCAIAWPTGWDTTGIKAYRIDSEGMIKWRGSEGSNPDWNADNYPKRLGER